MRKIIIPSLFFLVFSQITSFATAAIDCDGLYEIKSVQWKECVGVNSASGWYVVYETMFLFTVLVAGIITGIWLYKKRKKQGKSPIVGSIIFGISISMIILFLIFAWIS